MLQVSRPDESVFYNRWTVSSSLLWMGSWASVMGVVGTVSGRAINLS